MPLSADFRQKLVSALSDRGAKTQCEICGQNDWAIVDQAISIHISDLSGNVILPPPQIPSAALICNNCGNIRLFALGALNLLPQTSQ